MINKIDFKSVKILPGQDDEAKKYELWSQGSASQTFRAYNHYLVEKTDPNYNLAIRALMKMDFCICMSTLDAVKKYEGIDLFVFTV